MKRIDQYAELDRLIDNLSRDDVKFIVRHISGFSCVPYKADRSQWCSGHCINCWIKFLEAVPRLRKRNL